MARAITRRSPASTPSTNAETSISRLTPRLRRDLVRRLEQRAHVDVEAQVGERGGDDLLTAVVPVLAHLGDQDARPSSFRLLERLGHAAGLVQRSGTPCLVAVDAGDGAHL